MNGKKPQSRDTQIINYWCRDCGNQWKIKVSESEEFKEALDRATTEYRETFEILAEYDRQ